MSQYKLIPLDKITISPRNPRRVDPNDPKLNELSESILAHGVLQPVMVRPHGGKGQYELLYGQRRFLATRLARMTDIPCTVSDLSDTEALDVMIVENLQRQDPTPLEEGRGVAAMLETRDPHTVAGILAKSVSWVRRRAKLAMLSPAWLTMLEGTLVEQDKDMEFAQELRRDITAGHLELVAHFPEVTQDAILKKLKNQAYMLRRGVKDFQYMLNDYTLSLEDCPFDLASAEFGPSCAECSSRSDREPDLFRGIGRIHEVGENGEPIDTPHCLDGKCFKMKYEAFIQAKVEAAAKKMKQPVQTMGNNYGSNAPKADFDKWSCTEVKKGEKGAVPVIQTDGPDAGKLVYVIPPMKSEDGKETRNTRPTESPQDLIKRRRLEHMVDAIAKWIDERKENPPSLDSMPRMMAAMLTYGVRGDYPQRVDGFHKFLTGSDSNDHAFANAWAKLSESMQDDIPGSSEEGIDLALEVLGLERSDFEAEAEKAFPDIEETEKPTKKGKGKKGGAA